MAYLSKYKRRDRMLKDLHQVDQLRQAITANKHRKVFGFFELRRLLGKIARALFNDHIAFGAKARWPWPMLKRYRANTKIKKVPL